MKIRLSFLITVLAFAGMACSSDKTATPGTPSSSATSGSTVTVAGLVFAPDPLEVAVGTKVTWKWAGNIPHNVVANDGSFTSGDATGDDTLDFTFATAGTFGYVCEVHKAAGMTGTIVVS